MVAEGLNGPFPPWWPDLGWPALSWKTGIASRCKGPHSAAKRMSFAARAYMAHVRQMRVCEWQVAQKKGSMCGISCRCERRVGFDRAPRGSHAHGSAQSSTERALAPPQPSQRFATRPGIGRVAFRKFQNRDRVIVASGMFQPVAHSQRLCLSCRDKALEQGKGAGGAEKGAVRRRAQNERRINAWRRTAKPAAPPMGASHPLR